VSAHEHEHARERLSAWLDGELPAADAAAVEAHVAACAECAALAAEMTAVEERFRESPAEAPPGYFDTFAARVRARVETEPRRTAARRVPAWTWAAAAALLLAVVTPLTLRGRVSVPPAAAVLEKAEAGPATQTRAAGGASSVPSPAMEQKAAAGGTERLAALPAPAATSSAPVSDPAGGGSSARPQGRAAEPAAAPPTLLDRAAAPRAERQGLDESAANQVAGGERGIEGGVEGGVPGGVVGGVVSGAPQTPAPAAAAAEREKAPAAAGFSAASSESRAKAVDAPRRAASATAVSSDAVARDEADASSLTFARLAAAAPRSAEEWRVSREEWRSFAAAHATDPRVDEARVRAVEAAFEAARASGAAADRRTFDADAAAYLARTDASQKGHVRALVRRAEALPR
jgi:hypothetical protein